ncbi:hypothetical protein D6D23_09161 [Aureobasidium pullulans]|nr:hypothetical protein D6D23_09161 [Aureobasidium pullulans]
MEIKHPRRILVIGKPDSDISRVVKEITGSAPTPDASTGFLAGITHEWNVKTAYYTATIPIWIDEITDTTAWKSEFLNTEAKEVVQAVGAWIYCFNSSDIKKESADDDAEVTMSEHVEATMKAVAEVVEKACGMMWDGTRLAVDLTPANKGRSTINAEEICLDLGFEYIHIDATGKNEYGENLGLERAKEALEANEWSASSADDDDDEDNVGGMDDEQAQMNAELWGMKASLLDPDNEGDEAEGSALEIEDDDLGVLDMMNIANWITETTAGMPENERKKYAARAVDDLMKNFD